MPVTINGDGSITGLSVGGLGSGVVNTATLADGAATQAKRTYAAGEVVQIASTTTVLVTNLGQVSPWDDVLRISSFTPKFTNSIF